MTVSLAKMRYFIFAGGGTGGHIYPNLAVSDALSRQCRDAQIIFFCSSRDIDARILAPSGYDFLPLPAIGFSLRKCLLFFAQFVKSYYFVKQILTPIRREAVVIGTGGFVTAPVVLAAKTLKIPIYLINVDSVPGKANRFLARFANKVFVQFAETAACFKASHAEVLGCPLRSGFQNPDRHKPFSDLALEENKKILLITGASSGSASINNTMISILPELNAFAAVWQVVHLTGLLHIEKVKEAVKGLDIAYHAVDYYDDMPNLLAAADVVVGRAGAVSVAEYAAAGVPAVCLPYPYHKDRHQYKNAHVLADAGAAVIVDDNISNPSQTAHDLLTVLKDLLADDAKRGQMAAAARKIGITDAAERILAAL
ncbi:MAG TPA: UDP-N-acetylglucosamine--N-acetylmuramyl-(pentapeptide) pyrophosphoryl-undecaprenol N-acetylglucosamine transferase [Anaerohalosphaeraceae bacterium]|nr:UDP-N-acetylglucosamine--N-acetylmuramyl-(pentapeptide) pyrophosphoryl-undecaprenol N-acetylglucosamine transferase [Anaerohalosphaeraceae bacterium]HOM76637.1 UDP-N-acetylglucosamine--N-acetylmuramyl-(pentapeptide) pyrophosphoryl-undecaprenol N-acetylglucosamine transferase [Anaerohalosphaeraceae bacterium]HPC63680.1 UDP-N-acetylglucosamine--N-acetylmuramyl-(pentapeptide) pyrophosphoryl-undecaprenol N-acetylglucosamine transferase [Anaerohalosphaeraceae bacterium]HPO69385.1 UDP-N-acetylgluco